MIVKVDPARCTIKHVCPGKIVCPKKAISQEGMTPPTVDMSKCNLCRQCVMICPRKAFREIKE